jgi:hypothetical protein
LILQCLSISILIRISPTKAVCINQNMTSQESQLNEGYKSTSINMIQDTVLQLWSALRQLQNKLFQSNHSHNSTSQESSHPSKCWLSDLHHDGQPFAFNNVGKKMSIIFESIHSSIPWFKVPHNRCPDGFQPDAATGETYKWEKHFQFDSILSYSPATSAKHPKM